MKIQEIPTCFKSDSYKYSHMFQWPKGITKAMAYTEARSIGFLESTNDHRIISYGIRYVVEEILEKQWTLEDVNYLKSFLSTHNTGSTPYPFPEDLFRKFINENNGYFPIQVKSIPEGTAIYPHTTICTYEADEPYAELVTFLESAILEILWYATTVATLSAHVRTLIEEYFDLTVDPDAYWKLDSRLHDFGYRGTTCLEQAVLGGTAHLLNFRGSDTVPACYYAQYHLNGGKSVAESIPATEHSVMTSWQDKDGVSGEERAVRNMMERYGFGVYATVADSYDYLNFLDIIVPRVKELKESKGGFWVIRPDSGDPIETVLDGLVALERTFGATANNKGYLVVNGAGIIYGDGVDLKKIKEILAAVVDLGFSVENVAFGMGGGLLQKVNRDSLKFATKLCYTETREGSATSIGADIWKHPSTDPDKCSMPGHLQVNMNGFVPQTYPLMASWEDKRLETDMLQVVYNCGPVDNKWSTFDEIRAYIRKQMLVRPKIATGLSDQMKLKMDSLRN